MSTERDIIIERYEQKLAARDKELQDKIEQMRESLRESILVEIEKQFADKLKLRESTIDEIGMKFGDKINEILEMNKSLRDSVMDQQKLQEDTFSESEDRMNRIERRLVELNSAYDGVMKELLDQKSIIQELTSKKKPREEPKEKQEIKPPQETKPAEKPKPKGEYIVAANYTPKDKSRQQQVIEAEEKTIVADEVLEREQLKREIKKSEKVKEGVEIFETLKKR